MHALVLYLLTLLPASPAAPTCLTNFGKTACGYHCRAAHGEVACAKTSAGVCDATEKKLVCWDPSDIVRAHYGDAVPRPACLTRSGNIRCGYHCQASDSEIRCAWTPDGICVTTPRGVTCWDPPAASYCADNNPLPRPQCISVNGYAACGYGCLARNGELACAVTPGGSCQTARNGIACMDPESPPSCGGQPCRPDDPVTGRLWCRPPQ